VLTRRGAVASAHAWVSARAHDPGRGSPRGVLCHWKPAVAETLMHRPSGVRSTEDAVLV
jgi:hypothetical protein